MTASEKEIMRWYREAVKRAKEEVKQFRESTPRHIIEEGDRVMAKIFEDVKQLVEVVGKAEGVKISKDDLTVPSAVGAWLVGFFVQNVVSMYSKGMDVELATSLVLSSMLSAEALTSAVVQLGAELERGDS